MKKPGVIAFFFQGHFKLVVALTVVFAVASLFEAASIGSIYPLLNNVFGGAAPAQAGALGSISTLNRLIALLGIADPIVASCVFAGLLLVLHNALGFVSDALSIY